MELLIRKSKKMENLTVEMLENKELPLIYKKLNK